MQHLIWFLRLGTPLNLVNTCSSQLFSFFCVGITRISRVRLKNVLWKINLCEHSCAWLYHYVKEGKVVCVYVKWNEGANTGQECQRGKKLVKLWWRSFRSLEFLEQNLQHAYLQSRKPLFIEMQNRQWISVQLRQYKSRSYRCSN